MANASMKATSSTSSVLKASASTSSVTRAAPSAANNDSDSEYSDDSSDGEDKAARLKEIQKSQMQDHKLQHRSARKGGGLIDDQGNKWVG